VSLAGQQKDRQIRDPMSFSHRRLHIAFRGVLITLFAAAIVPVGSLRAQAPEGESGMIGLVLPVGARPIGQGRAISAVRGEIQGLPYNPSAIVGLDRGALTFSRFEGAAAADFNTNYIAGAWVTRWGTVGVHALYLDFGSIPLTRTSPDPIGSVEISEWAVGVTFAREWRRAAWGATAKIVRSDLGVADAGAAAFDLGVIFTPGPDLPLRLSFSLRNLGPDLKFEETGEAGDIGLSGSGDRQEKLPSRVRVGVSSQPELGLPPNYAVLLAFDIESDLRELSASSIYGGGALTVNDAITLRAGLVILDNPFVDRNINERNVGGSFGVGIHYGGFEADVSREVSVSELDDETHFAVGWRF
jgi:hypothetical protein